MWVDIVLAVIAALAAVVAVWQASEARKSRQGAELAVAEARRAADASERQAAAAERAIELQEAANKKPEWRAVPITADKFAIINETQRVILVERIDVEPSDRPFYHLDVKDSGRYEPGDRFSFLHDRRFTSRAPEKLIILWSYEGETAKHRMTFAVT